MNNNVLSLIVVVILALQVVILLALLLRRKPKGIDLKPFEDAVSNAVTLAVQRLEAQISRENSVTRDEVSGNIDRLRESLTKSNTELRDTVARTQAETRDTLTKSQTELRESLTKANAELRESLAKTQSEMRDTLARTQTEARDSLAKSQTEVREKLDERLEKVQNELAKSLTTLQTSNEQKLDQMRQTVDEKLEKTLETRLQKSFETVSLQLESVNKGLGEMKTVAESVGTLNKVLSGTKSRGILGELQLGRIIEDIMPSTLYEREAATVPGSSEHVEYAIKLPGAADGEHVHLPIDSKFPLEPYQLLLDEYETGDKVRIETAQKALKARVKGFAQEVKRKYVLPPYTTNFAVLFLPTEGLYAEIVRDSGFFDGLRQDGIMVAGPSTLSAMLNSLDVGFKTLQIQKGAANIEKTLGAVKSEFEKFGGILDKAHKKIVQAGNDLETLRGTRTNAIKRTLKEVQAYSGADGQELLGIAAEDGSDLFLEDGSEDDGEGALDDISADNADN
jgi:DNA recombination protein RmuC